MDDIISDQFPNLAPESGFQLINPYSAEARATVRDWQNGAGGEASVCAVQFTGTGQRDYELGNFDSTTTAIEAGFSVTHQGRCGSCSTLRDLAVYMSKPDLTTPARQCARRFGLDRKKRCYEEEIGFTSHCAESWAYNAQNTRRECSSTCIGDYGLLNLIFRRYPGENTDVSGQLRPCLSCDENLSGPGFKYSAGRTRRNSGILSAITRPESEVFKVDHSAYFQ
jgi:hypothetical protein